MRIVCPDLARDERRQRILRELTESKGPHVCACVRARQSENEACGKMALTLAVGAFKWIFIACDGVRQRGASLRLYRRRQKSQQGLLKIMGHLLVGDAASFLDIMRPCLSLREFSARAMM
jgi:hypothetical protein